MAEDWVTDATGLGDLESHARRRLARIRPTEVDAGTVLFEPGDAVRGYVIVLKGRVEVRLAGPTGRDILLYSVEPGQACIQSTLGLLGGDIHYSAEAVAVDPGRVVLLPSDEFVQLVETSAIFRRKVFAALAERMQSTMQILETISFIPIEARLARFLLAQSADGVVAATHQEIAVAIGSAREVVSRQLERLAARGAIRVGRGRVHILAPQILHGLAAPPM